VCGAIKTVRIVRGVRKRPTEAEATRNRRAASARLRVAEKLDASGGAA
jgi:16S rRNA C1402 N4-methylase RsmH